MITKFILRLKNKDSKFMHVSSFKDNQLLSPLVILEGMKLICGTRIAGMNHKTRKEDKSILVPMMMKKLLLKDKQPLYVVSNRLLLIRLNGIKSQAICSFCTKLTDTVSSEIGKTYGKTTYLVTSHDI
ncbi:unnamed protein product [Camellia sinensis]